MIEIQKLRPGDKFSFTQGGLISSVFLICDDHIKVIRYDKWRIRVEIGRQVYKL